MGRTRSGKKKGNISADQRLPFHLESIDSSRQTQATRRRECGGGKGREGETGKRREVGTFDAAHFRFPNAFPWTGCQAM